MDTYVVPDSTPCVACLGSALVGLCGRTDNDSDGPCVLTSDHSGPCWGEGDVASDWTPAKPCRTCCVCPCGSTIDGTECRFCHVVMKPGVRPPRFSPSTHRPEEGQ